MKRYEIPSYEYCAQSPIRSSLHGCIMYSGKQAIYQSTNLLPGVVMGKYIATSRHAEMSVCHATRFKRLTKPVIVVVRYNRNRELVNSYPCNSCIDLLKKLNIYKIIYSNEHGELVEERVKNLEHKHCSNAMRRLNIKISWSSSR